MEFSKTSNPCRRARTYASLREIRRLEVDWQGPDEAHEMIRRRDA